MPASAISPLRRLFANALATALASALLPCAAVAGDQWPSRPLHLIVGFPAGSSPDLTARALAEPLGKALGQLGKKEEARALLLKAQHLYTLEGQTSSAETCAETLADLDKPKSWLRRLMGG